MLASIQFHDLLIRFASDPVLGMLPESGKPLLKVTNQTKCSDGTRSPVDSDPQRSRRHHEGHLAPLRPFAAQRAARDRDAPLPSDELQRLALTASQAARALAPHRGAPRAELERRAAEQAVRCDSRVDSGCVPSVKKVCEWFCS